MNRILTYLFASVFIVLGASTAIASTAPNQEAIADKIVKQGFVDPKFYDKPSHLAEHKAALQWMNTLNNEQLTKLANDFYVTNKIGGPIEQDLLKAFKGGMYRGWENSKDIYAARIQAMEQCAQSGVAGAGSIVDFKPIQSKTIQKYYRRAMNLAAAFISVILKEGQQPPVVPAVVNNNNNAPAAAQPAAVLSEREQARQFGNDLLGNFLRAVYAPANPLAQEPPVQAAPAAPAQPVNVMEELMKVNYNPQLGEYVNKDGLKPMPVDEDTVLFYDKGKDLYFMYDTVNGNYYQP